MDEEDVREMKIKMRLLEERVFELEKRLKFLEHVLSEMEKAIESMEREFFNAPSEEEAVVN